MIITCRTVFGSPRRIEVLADGEPVRKVSCSIVPEKVVESIPKDEQFFGSLAKYEQKGAIRYALSELARRAMHSSSLEKSLRRHCVPTKLIEETVSYCQSCGFLNDEEWVERRVQTLQKRGLSPLAIRSRLRGNGISAKISLDEEESLQILIRRKYPALLQEGLSFEEKAKIVRALQRRGFSFSAIQQSLAVPME